MVEEQIGIYGSGMLKTSTIRLAGLSALFDDPAIEKSSIALPPMDLSFAFSLLLKSTVE